MSSMSKSLDAGRLAQLAADPAEHVSQPAEGQEPVVSTQRTTLYRIKEQG